MGEISQGIEGKAYTKTYTGSFTTVASSPGTFPVLSIQMKNSSSYYVWFVINGYCTVGPELGQSFQQQTQSKITMSSVGVTATSSYQSLFSGSVGWGVGQTVTVPTPNLRLNIIGNATDTWRWTWHAVVNINEAV